MRIGQLARRLGIPPSDILGFLAAQNIEVGPESTSTGAGTNSRLREDQVTCVVNHFAPEKLAAILAGPVVEQTEAAPEIPVRKEETQREQSEVIQDTQQIEETVSETTESLESEATPIESGPPEVIRVAKVELQGLKVLGKIELPQPKKKEELTPEIEGEVTPETDQVTTKPATERPLRKEYPKRNDRREYGSGRNDLRTWKNPLEQKRQQEAQEAERKRQEKLEREKEKRANHYYSKVKSVPTKAARRFDEQTVVEDVEVKEPPKSIIGKFFHWLRN